MKEKGKDFTFELHKGDSKETLVNAKESIANANFAYIDGGHSEETVISDYENLKHCDVIVFDDYFTEDVDGKMLGDENLGSINRLGKTPLTIHPEREGRCIVLPSQDRVKGWWCYSPSSYCYRRMAYLLVPQTLSKGSHRCSSTRLNA
jgi:hypothetical protein